MSDSGGKRLWLRARFRASGARPRAVRRCVSRHFDVGTLAQRHSRAQGGARNRPGDDRLSPARQNRDGERCAGTFWPRRRAKPRSFSRFTWSPVMRFARWWKRAWRNDRPRAAVAGRLSIPTAGSGTEIARRRFCERAALFLDRDGVIVEDTRYLGQAREYPDAAGCGGRHCAMQSLGIPVVLVSNQSGIARRYYDWDGFHAVQAALAAALAAKGRGAARCGFCLRLPRRRQRAVECRRSPVAQTKSGNDPGGGRAHEARSCALLDRRRRAIRSLPPAAPRGCTAVSSSSPNEADPQRDAPRSSRRTSFSSSARIRSPMRCALVRGSSGAARRNLARRLSGVAPRSKARYWNADIPPAARSQMFGLRVSPRIALVVAHDLFVTAAAIFASFYIRFEAAGLRGAAATRLCYVSARLRRLCRHHLFPVSPLRIEVAVCLAARPDEYRAGSVGAGRVAAGARLRAGGAKRARRNSSSARSRSSLYWILQIVFLSAARMTYRYFRYTRTRHHARSPDSNPALVFGRAADAEVLLRAIESGAVTKTWPAGILSPSAADQGQSIRGIPVLGGFDALDARHQRSGAARHQDCPADLHAVRVRSGCQAGSRVDAGAAARPDGKPAAFARRCRRDAAARAGQCRGPAAAPDRQDRLRAAGKLPQRPFDRRHRRRRLDRRGDLRPRRSPSARSGC